MATVNLGSIKFKWQGAYNGATAYTVDDVVSYNGSSYICIANSTGNLPTDTSYFEQMSAKGTDGTNGTNGTDLSTTLTTQGDLVYRDGSGLQRLGAGTAGQVLQTGGAGANPSWGTVSSDYVLLATQTVSGTSSAVSFDGYFSSTYDVYKCVFYNLDLSTDNLNLSIRFRVSNADVTDDYRWANGFTASISSGGTSNSSSATGSWYATSISQINWNPIGQTLGAFICQGELTFLKPLDTSNYKMVKTDFIYYTSDGSVNQHITGFGSNYNSTSALSGFTIYPNSSTLNRGTFKLYGIK